MAGIHGFKVEGLGLIQGSGLKVRFSFFLRSWVHGLS